MADSVAKAAQKKHVALTNTTTAFSDNLLVKILPVSNIIYSKGSMLNCTLYYEPSLKNSNIPICKKLSNTLIQTHNLKNS